MPRPRETTERCALRAQLRGDPMLGTAFPAGRVLAVEQPGPWGSGGLRESRFDPAVARRLEADAGSDGVRVLAIRRFGRTRPDEPRHWLYADCRPGRETLRVGTYARPDELLDLPRDGTAGEERRDPMFLVCAHSKHDTCCALRGRPVAAALTTRAPGRVWECSHVGGERFAANVLVLPAGLLYGRVLPFAASEFVEAADAGEVIGALLRGRIGFVPAAQAAMAFAYEQLGLRRASEIRVVQMIRKPNEPIEVRLATPHGLVDVAVALEQGQPAKLTCHATGPSGFVIHRPIRIVPVE